ncbi:MAG: hypothetical protein SFU85_03220 [Candidatus Methylacidiphilales bacterium]|nr:hypothetical protein [Candidatus Methylacidiphilales bacterium]
MTFRIHVQVQSRTEAASQTLQISLTNPNQIIAVNRLAAFSENHLQSVLPTPDGGMMLQADSTGTRILEEMSSSNSGRIMVVLINGTVVYAPIIDMPLRSGRMLIPGPIPPEIVSGLQARIAKLQKK